MQKMDEIDVTVLNILISEEPRYKLQGIFQGKSLIGGCHPHTPFAIHSCSKLQGFLAFSHNLPTARWSR